MAQAVRNTATDHRNQPAYPLAEAARYLKLPPATLRSWVVGRDYDTAKGSRKFKALVMPPAVHPPVLSFWNLIEAHVLRALRTDHGISVKAVRDALQCAESELHIDRLLLSRELSASAGWLFLDRYGDLIELSASGQIAMRKIFEAHLDRVVWDDAKFPIRLYPVVSAEPLAPDRPIAIDPQIAFGRPILVSRGITTATITDRIDAGETVPALAADYDLTPKEIEEAILYERVA